MGKWIGSNRFLEHSAKREEGSAVGLTLKSSAQSRYIMLVAGVRKKDIKLFW